MKKFIFTTLTICLICFSCDQDLLNIEQKGAIELLPFYENASDADAESLIAAVHKRFYNDVMGTNNILPLNLMSDDHYCGGNSFQAQSTNYRLFSYYTLTNNSSQVVSLYTALYKLNYWCNLICENITDDSEVKSRVIAEAKFFRAVCNMYLVRIWGTPPFVPSSETSTTPKNGNPSEIWDWIETNLEEAAAALPSKTALGTQQSIGGRPSKEAALAYLGKALVLQGKYSEASPILFGIIDSKKFALIDDMSKLFHVEADFSDEYLFEYNAENDATTGSSQTDMRYIQQHWRFTNLTPPSISWPNGWGLGQSPTLEFVAFAKNHEAVDDGYSQRYHNTIKSYEDILAMEYPSGVTPGVKKSAGYVVDNIGYWGMRWFLPISEVITGTDTDANAARSFANQPYLRYADVLLLYAEAEIKQGRSTGAGLDALNEVRLRAGLPALASMTLQDVKDERRIEFWGDGERFLDLVRWGDAPTVLAEVNKYRYQFYGLDPDDGSYKYTTDGKVYGVGFKEGKNEVWPFPETELLANPNLIQNPNW